MKYIFFLPILVFIYCSQKPNKNPEKFTVSKEQVGKIVQDTIDLEKVFGSTVKYQKKNEIIFNNKLSCKYIIPTGKKQVTILPLECVGNTEHWLNEKFVLIETNDWIEEALPHKDLYYKRDNFIVVFDMLKYCDSKITKDYFVETIRVYKEDDYYNKAKKTGSIKYYLKSN